MLIYIKGDSKMTIKVTLYNTVFGTVEKRFNSMEKALEFMRACVENEANFTVDIS